MRHISAFLLFIALEAAPACELCAIYNASGANGGLNDGFTFTVAEQYVPYDTSQFNGQVVHLRNPSYVNSSITHLVPTYNFSSRFGVSLNVPLEYLSFKRTDLLYSLSAPPVLFTEQGTESGLGDMALVGRVALYQLTEMSHGVVVSVLGGVKFPTGNSSRLQEEVAQAELFQSFLPPGTPHDPLSHSVSSVHQHNLALGSGSYDGVFGLTTSARWGRWYFNGQFQYYLRTEGESGFQYGNELMISGGPGAYVLLGDAFTLSLQANAAYDTMARDQVLGQTSNETGMTAWYLGPLLALTWGSHFSANAGVDIPMSIANSGFQSVPSYRIHGGVSWRF